MFKFNVEWNGRMLSIGLVKIEIQTLTKDVAVSKRL